MPGAIFSDCHSCWELFSIIFSGRKLFLVIFLNLTLWYLISFILIKYLNVNIYKVIIAVGTFALALAFAGNDLVNFIGVPIAAFQSYENFKF